MQGFGWAEAYRGQLENLREEDNIVGIRQLLDEIMREKVITPLIEKEYEFRPPKRLDWRKKFDKKPTNSLMTYFAETQMAR